MWNNGTHATTVTTPADAIRTQPLPELVCAEVWGGNRPISAPLELPGLRGKLFSRPAQGGRGGDVHYVSICSSGLLSRLCVADVAGHGESVALVSAELHRLLRRYINSLDERKILGDLNRSLESSELRTMTTAAAASYFPPLGTLWVSYAGHPPGWLYTKRQDRWTRFEADSPGRRERRPIDLPLAVDTGTSFTRRKAHVQPGDRFVLVTDGVLEAPAPDRELYGEGRLMALLHDRRHAPAAELADSIVAALVAHTGDKNLSHDDVTLLVVEFGKGPKAFGIWEGLKNRLLGPRPRRRKRQ